MPNNRCYLCNVSVDGTTGFKQFGGHVVCQECFVDANFMRRAIRIGLVEAFPEEPPAEVAEKPKTGDPVNHPDHYTMGGVEVIDAIEAWDLGPHEANVVKYVARAKYKGKELQDLKKAKWYLDRKIQKLEKRNG